jgi:hypothetical protein
MTNTVVGALLSENFTADQMSQGKGFGLGDRYTDSAGNEYVFVTFGTGGATPNFVCTINAANSAVMATNTVSLRGERVGVYVGTGAALANDFGWLQIYGTVDAQVLASCAANARITTTTTAGALDDAAGVGTKDILGMVLTTARAASQGNAPALLVYPSVGATL